LPVEKNYKIQWKPKGAKSWQDYKVGDKLLRFDWSHANLKCKELQDLGLACKVVPLSRKEKPRQKALFEFFGGK